MSSALTREYAEGTSESKTSFDVQNLNNRKRDSETYQSIVSEGFYFGSAVLGRNLLRFCGFTVLGDLLRGF